MKQKFTAIALAALLIFSSFSLTAHAATKKTAKTSKEIAVTYKRLGRAPRVKGGYEALVNAPSERQVAFAIEAEKQIMTQTGLEGDGDNIADQIAKQLADKSAKAVTIPTGTTMAYMGSARGTVFGQFVLAEPLAGHEFALKLQDTGKKKYSGTLRIFDKCANENPLQFAAVPVEVTKLPVVPPVTVEAPKGSPWLFRADYNTNGSGRHQLEKGQVQVGKELAPHTRLFLDTGFYGSEKVVTRTIHTCKLVQH